MIFSREQKRILVKSGTIVLALFLVFICYSYIIPRTEIEIDTVYHSSYSALFVQSKINNAGTEEITDLKIKSSVWNDSEMLETETHYPGILQAKQSVKLPPLLFDGPHADEYYLVIVLEFNGKEGKQNIVYSYKIKDYGNLAWHDQFLDF
ncbi:MAG: hypothetical protein CXT75_07575 [Methanobacteriota archaeon]|jgi:hypothetical protein|nr:MAG: hypothetical protein CXT75_07575 [Euryarchaeota archaeon]